MSLYLVAVAARDEPGALAWVSRNIARWQVNLKGFVVDQAGMQLLVTDLGNLTEALHEMGFLYRVCEVQEVVLEDRPGALAALCQALADQGIGICTAFGVASGQAARVYLNVTDTVRAGPILETHTAGPALVNARLGRIGPITR